MKKEVWKLSEIRCPRCSKKNGLHQCSYALVQFPTYLLFKQPDGEWDGESGERKPEFTGDWDETGSGDLLVCRKCDFRDIIHIRNILQPSTKDDPQEIIDEYYVKGYPAPRKEPGALERHQAKTRARKAIQHIGNIGKHMEKRTKEKRDEED